MNVIFILKKLRHELCLSFCHCLPIKNNKVMLWANSFHAYGDSPKYIAEYLLKNKPGQYDIIWVLETGVPVPEDIPEAIRIVRYFSMEYLREISTAKFIICNSRTGPYHYFNKRKEQVYIQTWHSSLRLKMIEGDAPTLPTSYVAAAKADSQKIDLLLSGCEFSTKIFRRAFWYNGEILEKGTPRCDLFFRELPSIREKVFRMYNIPIGSKLALYAPTFRDSEISQTHGINFAKIANTLELVTGDLWVVGCRYHPNLKNTDTPANSISMTAYPDMQELIAAADLLITDYSSCMFDMALSKKPCILYAPDIDEYTVKERNLYFAPSELPFPVATSMQELLQIIKCFDINTYETALQEFFRIVGNYENGHAAEFVAEYMEKRRCK